ncbi:MAG: heavy metal translocating P-type ATPase [Aminipila sp.]
METKFDITGMNCSACSSKIEREIGKLSGVDEVTVNLLTNNMKVKFDKEKLSNEDIVTTVKKAGYGATIHDKDSINTNKQGKGGTSNSLQSELNIDTRHTKQRLIASICFLIPLLYISMGHMVLSWLNLPDIPFMMKYFHGPQNSLTFAFSQFLLLLPILYLNQKYFIVGFKALWQRGPNMDSLIAIGAGAATLYGVFALFRIGYGLGYQNYDVVSKYSMDLYFESAGTILTLISIGKYLETKSKGKTSEAITKLMNLSPKTAFVERDGIEVEIAAEEVIKGDVVIVRPGSSIPVDGIILEGSSSIDEAAITGESIPVFKSIGDKVVSATINKNGFFKFEATKVGDDTTLSQIIKLVEDASSSKAPIAKLADKISGIFVPIVIGISIISTIIWLLMGSSFEFALSIGIAVLVISCPCALGLATPVAIMVGTGKGAENGILIKSGEALELAHSINTVVMDKTGTITEGKPRVVDIICLSNDFSQEEILKIAGAIEKQSEHPLAEAVLSEVESRNIKIHDSVDFRSVPGRGACATIGDSTYFLGNEALFKENGINLENSQEKLKAFAKEGKTPLMLGNSNKIIGIITAMDTIKQNSQNAVSELGKMGIDVIMLTGDNKLTANAIKDKLGISEVIAEVLPEDKERKISELKNKGQRVAMIGDGINDAPALVSADVGIAIGAGTDIAIESADIVLMKSDLMDAVTAIKLSKAVIRNIKENLFWAFFYNTVGIPLAAGVFFISFGIKLNPMFGAAAMSLSSVCVVTNALRLKLFKAKNEGYSEKIYNNNEIKENKEVKKMVKINIEGMSCGHCTGSVEKVLKNIDGVKVDHVSLEDKAAYVEGNVDEDVVKKAIEEEGFKVVSVER